VASNGNDANPCTVVTAPCKTLARAYSATPGNGTIRVLTPLQGALTIGKNLTIEGNGATIVGGIAIYSSAAIVTLRGLSLDGVRNVATGIRIDAAATVHIEDCTVERYTNDGIKLVATTATKLFVVDTVSRDNGSDGLYADDLNALAEIKNSRLESNASSGLFLKVKTASVAQSTSSGNVVHGIILRTPNAKVTETTANDNGSFGLFSDLVSATVGIDDSHFEGNGGSGLSLQVSKASVTGSIASGNAQHGILLSAGTAIITDTIALGNSQHGFSLVGNLTFATFDSARTAGNGVAGLNIPNGTLAIMTDCVFEDSVGVNNAGLLASYHNNKIGILSGTAPDQFSPY